jgi:hypothetical protein
MSTNGRAGKYNNGRTAGMSAGKQIDAVEAPLRICEQKFLIDALSRRRSLLLYGQWGVGKTWLALRVQQQLCQEGLTARYFPWTSPVGDFVKAIAQALEIETTKTNLAGKEVRCTQAEILTAIGKQLIETGDILILDKAHSIPVTLRNYIEQWLEQGATIFLVATLPASKELYLKFPRWELKPLDYQSSYRLLLTAASQLGIKISQPELRQLATKGNGNPQFLIRSVVESDIHAESDPDQREWIDLSPVVLIGLCLTIVLRYAGQGMNDTNLIIMGGLATIAVRIGILMTGKISKQRARIGQK